MKNPHKSLQYDKSTITEYTTSAGLTTEGTPSEVEVLKLRSSGASILEISFKLNCSTRTIERRIKNIKLKILIYNLKKTLNYK